jgi:5,8-dihydroxy-2-naphthoate synthase
LSELSIAYSPCPNDTYLFHAWTHRLVGQSTPVKPHLADIEQLNQWALEGRFPLSKISWALLPELLDDYIALPIGAALGWKVGPKIVAREPFPLELLSTKRIAIPGIRTTAHRLLSLLAPEPLEKVYALFHETTALLNQQRVDCAVIIHEQRFTFANQGFIEIADLGELWEAQFGLPVPLGGLIARRNLGADRLEQICAAVHLSLRHANEQPHLTDPYVLANAREMEIDVVRRHIATYVTDESLNLSNQGKRAIEQLTGLKESDHWLFNPQFS